MSNFNDDMVSIITPAYNASQYISSAVESVLSQTYPIWELLVVDDCSSDNTVEIIKKWCEIDNRIKLIRQKINGGPAVARNAALEAAQGRWVAFLDSDDIWLPRKLECQLKFQLSEQAKISFTELRRISEDGSVTGRLIKVPAKINYRQLLGNTAIVTSSVIVDRCITGPFLMKKVFYDDFVCWLELLKIGGIAAGLKEDLLRYRVVTGSVSRNKSRSAKEVWKIFRKVERLNTILSVWYFLNYAVRGWLKYREF